MSQIYAYLIHLFSGFALLGVFFWIYVRFTPFHEITLIRQGNMAAALSLAGATIGFCLTLVGSILLNNTFMMFLIWGFFAMTVQLITYMLVERALPKMNAAISENNTAMGALMGTVSLVVGIINAACLS